MPSPQAIEYKCPCCGGELEFNTQTQKMKCPYCDNEFAPETLRSYDEMLNQQPADNMQWNVQPGENWNNDEIAGMSVYTCNSCGAEIVSDDPSTAATHCPYCDSPVVLSGMFSGDLRPDLVIPFKLDKDAAVNALKNHLKGKKLLPKLFKEDNHIEEVKGIYVPFWLFDAKANANMTYKATRVRTWESGGYEHKETSHFAVMRNGSIEFEAVPVDGSSKIADDLMESIEPYNLKDAVNFQTAYLSGYLANRYDVDAQQSEARANERIRKGTQDAFAKTVTGYTTVTPSGGSIQLENGRAKYALYPVWILNTKWNGENYQFAMNGQTGKFVGNLPMDKGAFWRWFVGTTVVAGGIAFAVLKLLNLI